MATESIWEGVTLHTVSIHGYSAAKCRVDSRDCWGQSVKLELAKFTEVLCARFINL